MLLYMCSQGAHTSEGKGVRPMGKKVARYILCILALLLIAAVSAVRVK